MRQAARTRFPDMAMEEAGVQYWLSPPDPQFEEKVKDICECYLGVRAGGANSVHR